MRVMLLLLSGVLGLPAHADSLYCGNDLISRGDHLIEVLEHCGEPAFKEEYVVRRSLALHADEPPYYPAIKPVSIKEWTYNFGRHKFMRQIRFEDGVVARIDTLDKGFR